MCWRRSAITARRPSAISSTPSSKGAVSWPEALVLAMGAALGGYAGARFSKSIGQEKARTAVIVIGLLDGGAGVAAVGEMNAGQSFGTFSSAAIRTSSQETPA